MPRVPPSRSRSRSRGPDRDWDEAQFREWEEACRAAAKEAEAESQLRRAEAQLKFSRAQFRRAAAAAGIPPGITAADYSNRRDWFQLWMDTGRTSSLSRPCSDYSNRRDRVIAESAVLDRVEAENAIAESAVLPASFGFTVLIKFVEPLDGIAASQHRGTSLTLNLEARDTIGTLKGKIANVTQIPKEELRLTHSCPLLRQTYPNMRNNGVVRGYMHGLNMENGDVIECSTPLVRRRPHRAREAYDPREPFVP